MRVEAEDMVVIHSETLMVLPVLLIVMLHPDRSTTLVLLTLAAMIDGLSFKERFGIVSVAPHDSGLCVETAAGVGGTRQYSFAPPGTVRTNCWPVVCKKRKTL